MYVTYTKTNNVVLIALAVQIIVQQRWVLSSIMTYSIYSCFLEVAKSMKDNTKMRHIFQYRVDVDAAKKILKFQNQFYNII